MVHPLDDQSLIHQMDKGDMLGELTIFSEACGEAIITAEKAVTSIVPHDYDHLVIAGMGGSAIGGLLLRDWLKDASDIPIMVSRDYHLPAYVGSNSLTIVVSYSGNTDETLSCLREAMNKNANIITVTSGGELLKISMENQIPHIVIPKGHQPRAALPYQFFTLATIARKIGLTPDIWHEVQGSIRLLQKLKPCYHEDMPYDNNQAKQLAYELKGFFPTFYGSSLLKSVAYRYSTQFNENSKIPSASSFIPEAFHNAVMAREADEKILENICAVLIRDPKDKDNKEKAERFKDLFEDRFGKFIELKALGEGRLERILSSIYLGDYASVYLGILYGKDPSSMNSIDKIKAT